MSFKEWEGRVDIDLGTGVWPLAGGLFDNKVWLYPGQRFILLTNNEQLERMRKLLQCVRFNDEGNMEVNEHTLRSLGMWPESSPPTA